MKNIILSVPIRSTIDRFIQSVTTRAGLAAWFTPDVTAEPKVGSTVELGFDAGISLTFRLDRLDSSGHVEWVLVEGPDEWKTSRVVFDAKATDGGAINYTFTHTNLPEDSGLTAFMGFGWAQHARSLKLLLETGIGEPHGSAGSRGWHPRG
jgi:hypothetical protein